MIYKNVNGTQKLVTNIRKPKKWRRFEYLESSGTLYIDTVISLTTSDKFEFECDFTYTDQNKVATPFFGTQSYTTGFMCMYHYTSNTLYTLYIKRQMLGFQNLTISSGTRLLTYLSIDTSNKSYSLTVNSNSISGTYTNLITDTTSHVTFFYGSNYTKYKSKCYSFKVKINSTLVRDYIPCEYNGQYGMWDLVEDKFYENKGTGTFTVGPEIANYDEVEKLIVPSTLLPSGVELYDYIENDGNQWINTGIIANSSTKVETKFLSSVVSPISVYGSQTGSADGFRLFWYNNILYAASGGYRASTSMTPTTSAIYATIHSYNTLTINNTSYSTASGNVFGNNLLLMRDPYSDSYRFNGKFYYCKIYNGDSLIRNLIPCTYFGEPGMWDTVTKLFYRNLGTGEFIVGNKIVLLEYEYLQNDGVAYINTGYYPNQSSKIICKERHFETGGTSFGEVEGSSGSGRNAFYIGLTQFGFDKVHTVGIGRNTSIHIVELSVNGLYKNGELIGSPSTSIASTWTSPRQIYLFALNRGNSVSINSYALYYFLIYDNNVLVRDLKPCLYNNQAGLWDSVECKFYGNAGTGTFSVGRPLSGEIPIWVLKNALVLNGTAYINTDIQANNNTKIELKAYSKCVDSFYFTGTRTGTSGSHIFSITGANSGDTILFSVNSTNTQLPDYTRVSTGYTFETWLATNGNNTYSCYFKELNSDYEYSLNNISYTSITNNTRNIFIFSNGFNTINSINKIYYYKIWQNNILVRDFVPATMGGRPGLYDKVNHKMYFNANSSGNFTVE